jgi:hypothetical protein
MPPGPGGAGPGTVQRIAQVELRLAAFDWPFARDRRAEIEAHWANLKRERPHIWNGSVLLTRGLAVESGRLSGTGFATDYASFIAWRDWGWPDPSVTDCFGAAVILSSEGTVFYGRMAGSTLNAGQVYPPSGTLEARDLAGDGRIDVVASIGRELAEETGLSAGEAEAGALWAVREGCWLCLAQELRFRETAQALVDRVGRFLAAEARPELDGLVALRPGEELPGPMPAYARTLARMLLAGGDEAAAESGHRRGVYLDTSGLQA